MQDRDISAIVVGFDGSAESGQALLAATEFCLETGATLKLVAVAEPPAIGASMGGGVDQGWYELKVAIEKHLRERLRAARETVPEGVDVETSLIGGDPAKTLTSAATTSGTLLLVGSRAYGPARRVLLGSVSSKLVRSTPCPLIVHPRGMHAEEDAPAAAPRGLQASGSLFGRAALR